MAKNHDRYHPQPCATCGHRDMHGEVAGCIAVTSGLGERTTWCDCTAYIHPRDKVKDAAHARNLGAQGADAALHGHAMTHDGTDWRSRAEARLDDLIASGREFTAEDVTDAVGVAPSPPAIGGLFQGRKSRMDVVGWKTGTRPAAHGRPLRVWKGKP